MPYIRGTGSSSSKCCGCGSRSYPCDPPSQPGLVCRTAEASITKCGFNEWTGYVSSPPKIYRTSTLAGTLVAEQTSTGCTICNSKNVLDYSGSLTISKTTCAGTDNRQLLTTPYIIDCVTSSIPSVVTATDVGGTGYNNSYTSTVHTATGSGCQAGTPEYNYTGTATNTLSDEWTTAELETDVTNAIPSFSGTFDSLNCNGAYYNKTSDELTITKRKMEYKFELYNLSNYNYYRISWNETFTPEGGGSTTVTPKSYVWNGFDTQTPVYTIDVPANEGTTMITDVTAHCTP